jgi:hypothetical protein
MVNTDIMSPETLNFTYGDEELSEAEKRLNDLDTPGEVLLNQAVHTPEFITETVLNNVPKIYTESLEELIQGPLLNRHNDGTVSVPDDVVFLPDGPGVRDDQLSGFLHSVNPATVRGWLSSLTGEDADQLPDKTLYRELVRKVYQRRENLEEPLDSVLPENHWTPLDDLEAGLNGDLSTAYRSLTPNSNVNDRLLLAGVLLPVVDEANQVAGVVIADEYRPGNDEDRPDLPTSVSVDREVEWERKPFSPAEQLKFVLLASDAVPFRVTKEGQPHRFDLKEVARVSDWSTEHLEYVAYFLLENGLLDNRDERFYLTDSALEWDDGRFGIRPFITRCSPRLSSSEEDDIQPLANDFSPGRVIVEILKVLRDVSGPVDASDIVESLVDRDVIQDALMAAPNHRLPTDKNRSELVETYLECIHSFGMIDRRENDDRRYYRFNERGQELLETQEIRSPEQEELPYILQPDGQLLVPLESPLDEFRQLNPFALLVKADRMLGYQIDRQSLVQALNDGWDAARFRSFLETRTDSIPEPLEDLFDETIGDVEPVNIRSVHHLIEFETGATAAKALNLLSNYEPLRIDETRIVLRSETSEDTIRRNLSRGGIRLSSKGSEQGRSPIIEVEGA